MGYVMEASAWASVVLVTVSLYLNTRATHVLPASKKGILPSVTFGLLCFCLRKNSVTLHNTLLSIHAIVASLVFYNIHNSNAALNRSLFHPLASSIISILCASYIPFHPSKLCTFGLLMIQSWSFLAGFLMLAVYPASVLSFVEPQHIREERITKLTHFLGHERLERCTAPSTSDVQLDVAIVRPAGGESDRWVLYMGGNAEMLENSCEDAAAMGDVLRANWVFYNPRGVGRSTGYVSDVSDLIDDAAAVMRFIFKRFDVPQSKLLLWGHSIGGGVAPAVARRYAISSPLLLDRTFSRLTEAAIRFSPLPPRATKFVIKYTMGDLDTVADCKSIQNKRLIIFHSQDEVITYKKASLGRNEVLKEMQIDSSKVIELRNTRVASPHNSLLTSFAEKEKIRQCVVAMMP